MSESLTITGFGFPELMAKLETMGETIQVQAARLILDGAQRIAETAKSLAPVDFGILKNLIYAEPLGDFGATVHADAEYSAYLEFGTGQKVNVPAGLEEYALQFKGIKEVSGIFPHPFLFPALDLVGPTIVADVEAMLAEVAGS